MIQVYPASSRVSIDLGWLKGARSFSFGEPFDPENTSFGVMRVCNDDEVAPGRGFGPHPHSDMEIVSVVLGGQIKHEDNLGNTEVTSYGQVQRMSAGTGVIHAEYNASDTEALRLLQLWFMPRERGLPPSYETADYDPAQLINALLPVVTPNGEGRTAIIHQDMTLYLSRTEQGKSISFRQEAGRRIFLFVIEGQVVLNEAETLAARDTARIADTPELAIRASEDSFFMLIDLP
ncbi:Quercetin 2,3-dioxygenase [Paenibacillus solanacearum]|uniref:Quercetin 2,3-dioxygenase n=1 Tax=Paenibacillus solanacearum TaxID=2048548 RepID=A0A916K7R7_9BACL|nr:pirin family protein [Paenibacillus solanacearum]CAG7644466.1 Quercetin 2,3-dioxygenase [Paenibacillus solanacearum]